MTDLRVLTERVLNEARPGEQIEIYVSRGTENEIRVYHGEIEQLTNATSADVGIRVWLESPGGARVGSAWAGSLDDEAVLSALTNARDNAPFATEDEYQAFARPDGVAPVSLELTDEGVRETSIDRKIAMALELETMVQSGDARIRQIESVDYGDYVAEAALASTMGISAQYARTGSSISVEVIANDGRADETGWGLSAGRGPGDLDLAKCASDAIRRATRMLGATKPSSMTTTAVFDPRTAATLLAIIAGSLSGDAVVRGRSFFAGRLGESVASPLVTLVDDPTDPRHYGATPFDGEGLATRRNVLINEGVLDRFVYDTVSGRRAGTQSTGSAQRGGAAGSPSAGCRALALSPGNLNQEEIFVAVGEGIFVESLMGIHSGVNPISGDFSVGVTGLMIRNGVLCEPVREITVASTLQRMLLDVLYVGNDVEWLPGSAAGQSLAIGSIAVSGG
jgi:PmbA protein